MVEKYNNWYLNSSELEAEDFLDSKKVNKTNIVLNDNPGFYIKKKKLTFDVALKGKISEVNGEKIKCCNPY